MLCPQSKVLDFSSEEKPKPLLYLFAVVPGFIILQIRDKYAIYILMERSLPSKTLFLPVKYDFSKHIACFCAGTFDKGEVSNRNTTEF